MPILPNYKTPILPNIHTAHSNANNTHVKAVYIELMASICVSTSFCLLFITRLCLYARMFVCVCLCVRWQQFAGKFTWMGIKIYLLLAFLCLAFGTCLYRVQVHVVGFIIIGLLIVTTDFSLYLHGWLLVCMSKLCTIISFLWISISFIKFIYFFFF